MNVVHLFEIMSENDLNRDCKPSTAGTSGKCASNN